MRVFFYGLFMDEQLLADKGFEPSGAIPGFVDGYRLRIGKRATLLPATGSRAYGVTMDLSSTEVGELYAQESVADYVSEPVVVEYMDGTKVEATCYNLPESRVSGTNKEYASALLEIAERYEFPESYLDEIRKVGA